MRSEQQICRLMRAGVEAPLAAPAAFIALPEDLANERQADNQAG